MTIVFTNGAFDVLHVGHIVMLKHAKSLGDTLIVAIDSDDKVRQMKGATRPFNCEQDRKLFLEAIKYVDEVRIFDTKEELEEMVLSIKPDIMVVGSDWLGHPVVGSEYAKQLVFFPRLKQYSTTRILER